MKQIVRLLCLPVVLAFVLAGCGGGQTSQPGADPAPVAQEAPAKKPEVVKEAVTAKIGGTDRESLKHLPLFLSSFGKTENVQVSFTEYSSGTKATQGLLAKEVDFGFLQAEHILRDTSGELRIVGLVTRYPGNALVVNSKYKDQIKTVADLKGQKVGVSSMGAATHQFLLTLLRQNGVDAKSVNILPVGLNAPDVFSKDQVAAMVTIEPFITQSVEAGQAVVMIDARKAEGTKLVYGADQWPWIAVVTRKDVIDSNPELVERTIKSIAESLGTIATLGIDELIAQTPKSMFPNGDQQLFRGILQANRAQFSTDGRLTRQMVEPVWANMQENGAAPKDQALKYAEFVDDRFAK